MSIDYKKKYIKYKTKYILARTQKGGNTLTKNKLFNMIGGNIRKTSAIFALDQTISFSQYYLEIANNRYRFITVLGEVHGTRTYTHGVERMTYPRNCSKLENDSKTKILNKILTSKYVLDELKNSSINRKLTTLVLLEGDYNNINEMLRYWKTVRENEWDPDWPSGKYDEIAYGINDFKQDNDVHKHVYGFDIRPSKLMHDIYYVKSEERRLQMISNEIDHFFNILNTEIFKIDRNKYSPYGYKYLIINRNDIKKDVMELLKFKESIKYAIEKKYTTLSKLPLAFEPLTKEGELEFAPYLMKHLQKNIAENIEFLRIAYMKMADFNMFKQIFDVTIPYNNYIVICGNAHANNVRSVFKTILKYKRDGRIYNNVSYQCIYLDKPYVYRPQFQQPYVYRPQFQQPYMQRRDIPEEEDIIMKDKPSMYSTQV